MLPDKRILTAETFGVVAGSNGGAFCFLYTYEAPGTAV